MRVPISARPLFLTLRIIVALNETATAVREEVTEVLLSAPSAAPGERVAEAPSLVGLDAMRLAAVIDRRPCEFLLFGYRIDGNDAVAVLSAVASIQLLSFVGLDWFLG